MQILKLPQLKEIRLVRLILIICMLLVGQIVSAQQLTKSLPGQPLDKSHNLSRDLIGAWMFNEGAGSRVTDISENDNTGTIIGATWAGGKFGHSLEFDQVDDEVDVGSPAILDNMAAISVSMWVFPRGVGEAGQGRLISKRAGGAGWEISFGSFNNAEDIEFKIDYSSADLRVVTDGSILTLNTWNHVVLSWGGNQDATTVDIYVNGTEVGYTAQDNASGTQVDDSAINLIIGDNPDSQVSWDGFMDHVSLWNRALSSDEVKQLFQTPFVMIAKTPRWLRFVEVVAGRTRRVMTIN